MASQKSYLPKKIYFIQKGVLEGSQTFTGPYAVKPTNRQKRDGGDLLIYNIDENGNYIQENFKED